MNHKISVSERAVIQRINRRLKPDFQMLRKARGHTVQSVGEWYVVDYRRNFIVRQDVDVEDLARELEVLKAWEKAERDE